eukprot:18301_4
MNHGIHKRLSKGSNFILSRHSPSTSGRVRFYVHPTSMDGERIYFSVSFCHPIPITKLLRCYTNACIYHGKGNSYQNSHS